MPSQTAPTKGSSPKYRSTTATAGASAVPFWRAPNEQRSALRTPRSGPIWWKEGLRGDTTCGWLLEHSTTGAAFLVRGRTLPLAGTRIQTSDHAIANSPDLVREAFVRRVEPVHSDLHLVAIQFADGPVRRP